MNRTSAVDHSCLPSRQWRHGPAVVGLLALVALSTLPACWDGSAGFPGVHLTVKGVVQKGPPAASLVLALAQSDGGSLGAPQAIAATWAAGGRYQFDAVAAEGLIEVSARGRFFDEIRNADAADDIELKVAIPLVTTSRELQANVNVLTTLVAARIRSLVADGVEVTDATARAEHEFNLQFPLAQAAGTPGKFHLIDLAGSGDADAYGLVISLAFLQASHDSGVRPQVLLSQWTADFADNGRVNDGALQARLSHAITTLRIGPALASLHQRYLALGIQTDFSAARRLANRAPVSKAGAAVLVTVGQAVVLDGRASSDPDGGPVKFHWRVNREQNDGPYDNTPKQSFSLEGPVVEFVPSKTASYAIVLTVTDEFGLTAQSTTTAVARHNFVDNGNGTVTNLETGLMWQQFSDGNAYTMSEATGRSIMGIRNENNGLSVCANLALGGYADWRTPRLWEVESLRDFTFPSPRIDHAAFPGTLKTAYLSDSWAPNSKANYVEFDEGQVLRVDIFSRYLLRCVRGG